MKKFIVVLLLLIVAFCIFWFFYPLQSYLVMSIYSGQQSEKSVMHESGFAVNMPSGDGWYPFMLTFNATGFKAWSGIDADMSIIYNFGAFDLLKRTSSIYDTGSDRYSSFYGAYVVKKRGASFGFSGGKIDIDEMVAAVEYDYTQLVIAAFGCNDPVFNLNSIDTKENVSCAGSGGWTQIDACIYANGCAHNFKGDKTPYLQYGRPMSEVSEDFAITKLYGRVYAKYFEEYGCTVMLYVIAPNENAVQQCDDDILGKTIIRRV